MAAAHRLSTRAFDDIKKLIDAAPTVEVGPKNPDDQWKWINEHTTRLTDIEKRLDELEAAAEPLL